MCRLLRFSPLFFRCIYSEWLFGDLERIGEQADDQDCVMPPSNHHPSDLRIARLSQSVLTTDSPFRTKLIRPGLSRGNGQLASGNLHEGPGLWQDEPLPLPKSRQASRAIRA
jgi:hypothetical protein